MNENTLIDDVRFVITDVETTGLDPLKSRICEIAFIEMQGLSEIMKYSTLINPSIPIPSEVSSIHGISDDDVRDSPYFKDIAGFIADIFYDSVLVGHNIMFDYSFIDMEFKRIGMKMPQLQIVDTLVLSKKFQNITNTPNHKLSNIAKSINIDSTKWHRAMNDVFVTKEIFKYFLTILIKENGIKTLGDLLKFSKSYK